MTTFTWSISRMDTIQIPDPNYVVKAYWNLQATNGTETVSTGGIATFSSEQSESGFIPYNQLTQEIVLGWVKTQLGDSGVASYEESLQKQLTPAPTPEYTPLPWAAPAA